MSAIMILWYSLSLSPSPSLLLFQKDSSWASFLKIFFFGNLTATHNEIDGKINNMGGVTHSPNLSRFYSHRPPASVDSPLPLKHILLLVIWIFIQPGTALQVFLQNMTFLQKKIPMKSVPKTFFIISKR